MNFADQPDRNRKFGEAFETVIHGTDVVHHFIDIPWSIGREDFRFCCQYVLQRALRPFNLARQHGLFTDVHIHEQVWVGQRLDGPIETP